MFQAREMFSSRKPPSDVKKTIQKVLDPKKDISARLKHFKLVFDFVDFKEAQNLFSGQITSLYSCFHDAFEVAEANLRQKGQKQQREELEHVMLVFEKILYLFPDQIKRGAYIHSTTQIFRKLLHPKNSPRLRKEAMRLFLLWYGLLGSEATQDQHVLFSVMVPGLPGVYPRLLRWMCLQCPTEAARPVGWSCEDEPLPLLPVSPGEPSLATTRNVLEHFLSCMLPRDKTSTAQFDFLFEMFKLYYMPVIFPEFRWSTSLYKPCLELPDLHGESERPVDSPLAECQEAVIVWICKFIQPPRVPHHTERKSTNEGWPHKDIGDSASDIMLVELGDDAGLDYMIPREVIMSTPANVNFLHEVLRQAFLLHVRQCQTTLRVIHIYKDWVQMKGTEIPQFMMEPFDSDVLYGGRDNPEAHAALITLLNFKSCPQVRAGIQKLLQLFIVNAANCFLLELGPGSISYLNRQVDLCKRVLNIYRYMVMNVRMDPSTWTQLLLVLLQITTQIVKRDPPLKKPDTLGGRLAPALFQTLIVTWIKASLNVSVSVELWDQFLGVVSSLIQWEELIKEWGKTMDTLTRVMARLMYNLNLNDLPLEKLNEGVRNRKKRPPTVTHNTSTLTKSFSRSWSRCGSFISDKDVSTSNRMKEKERTVLRTNGHVPVSASIPEASTTRRSGRFTLTGKKSLSEGNLPLLTHRESLEDGVLSLQDTQVSKFASEYSCRVARCRSLELLPVVGCPLEETIRQSRSPSPAPSGASISKDSPMSIEVLNADGSSSIESTELADTESKSVMAQGPVKGWQPEVAVALWCRMLGAMGDPNNLKPSIHTLVFNYLAELAHTLIKLRKNQGLSLDNQWSPPPPDAIPPIHYFTPWCFKAATLTDDKWEKGRLLAYQTLMAVTLQKPDIPLSRDYLAMFYIIIHKGLTSNKQAVINCIVEHCESKLMCLNIAGSSMLLLDLISAVESIVYSDNIKMPRIEALKLLASILGQHFDVPVLLHDYDKLVTQTKSNMSERALKMLKYCGRKDPDSMAQCMALCSLGTHMYGELAAGASQHSLDDSLSVLIAALQSRKSVCMQVAADVFSVLTQYLVKHYGTIPSSILESLSCALSRSYEDKRVVSTLLFTMAGWCMSLPKHALVSSLLYQVFKVLHQLLEEDDNTSAPPLPHISITHSPRSSRLKSFMSEASHRKPKKLAKLATQNVLSHLINQLLHFPMRCGAARVSSVVVENDDIAGLNSDELHYEAFLQPNLELFMVNESLLLSLIELPSLDEGASASLGLLMAERQVRLIVRDISGKITWDTSVLFAPQENLSGSKVTAEEVLEACSRSQKEKKYEENVYVGGTLRHRPSSVLPHYKETTDDLDNLDDLLTYMRHSSKECITVLNDPANSPLPLSTDYEDDWITTVLNQRNFEMDFCHKHRSSNIINAMSEEQPQSVPPSSAFQHSRLLFSQLGLSAWEQRLQVHLVQKNQKLLRELKNLDTQKCRETHKFAVIYVAEGQEDKTSILSNNGGSDAYEEFVAGLGWEIELCMHTGFVGGLHRNGVSGDTAPYYADSFTEVLFHVATRMPTHTEEALLQKTRHLGNDEVHIVWSEHTRDYRRGIIPTEFCDILIVIYPLKNSLYRIQIERKSEVGFFGPLFDGMTVEQRVLPGLVRATAINASRSKRAGLPMYQNYYEERAGALQTIFESYRAQTTFEEFMASVCCPSGNRVTSPETAYVRSPPGLTAALLDANSLSVGAGPATRTNSSDT